MAAFRDALALMLQHVSTTLRSSHSKQLHNRATEPTFEGFLGPTRITERPLRAAGGWSSGRQNLCGPLPLDCLHGSQLCCP